MPHNKFVDLESQYGAHNYAPFSVTLVRGEGVHLWDDNDNRYLDMMSAYSAVSHGHCHPKVLARLQEQAGKLTVTSRTYHTETLGELLGKICPLTHMDVGLPMNTGAEAVETAIKAARKWGYTIKDIAENQAEIIVCQNNFHGRTTTIVGFSSEPEYREHFGPFSEGFVSVPFGDPEALSAAITENTAAFLVEPIQGEAGIIVPPEGYLKQCAEICKQHNVLLIVDEIQTGLGRTGKLMAVEHDHVSPDGLILGKALGGGVYPVSMLLGTKELMGVFNPGTHGSTFGGNPLACAVASTAIEVLLEENYVANSEKLGAYFLDELKKIDSPLITDLRGKGLFIGMEINPEYASAYDVCLALIKNGLITKDTHETVIRLAPPLVINKAQIDEAVKIIHTTLEQLPSGK